jgi:hypothetical protein
MVHGMAGGVVWTVLAFTLWLLLITVVRRLRLDAEAAIVAVLSWIGAGLLMWLLLPMLDWGIAVFHVGTASSWR